MSSGGLVEALEQRVIDVSATGLALGVGVVALGLATRKVSDVDAFELLRKTSMDSNRKLPDLAEDIVLTGDVNTSQAAEAPHR